MRARQSTSIGSIRTHRITMLGTFLFILCQSGCSRKTAALSPEKLFQKVSPSVFVVESLGQNGKALVLGSAVALGNNFLITNCHVVQDSWFLRVRRAKETWSATLIQASPDHDLCGLSVGSGQPQQWNPVAEFRQKWPKRQVTEGEKQDPWAVPTSFIPDNPMYGLKLPPGATLFEKGSPNPNNSDEEILQNLQDPAKFRSVFPNYGGLTDDQIRKALANHIKPKGPILSLVDIVPSSELATGERVYAVGAPEGLELTFSEGVISALRDSEGARMIQTSAAISPGSSGGGLFDAAGNLVGITTFYLKEGQSLNFALPGEWVTKTLKASTLPTGANHRAVSDSALESTAWIEIGLEAVNGKNYERAEAAFLKATRLQQSDAYRAWFEIGQIYGTLHREKDVVASLQETIRLKPDYAEGWSGLATTYLRQKEFGQAIKAAKESTRLDAGNKHSWMTLGFAYLSDHSYSEAVASLKQGLQANPNDEPMLQLLGMAYSAKGDHEQVVKIYEQLKGISSSSADSFFRACVLRSDSCW